MCDGRSRHSTPVPAKLQARHTSARVPSYRVIRPRISTVEAPPPRPTARFAALAKLALHLVFCPGMKWIMIACLWIASGATMAVLPEPQDKPYPGTIALVVDATDLDHRVVRVHETLPVAPGPLTLLIPRWIPGGHGPDGDVTQAGRPRDPRRRTSPRLAARCGGDRGASRRRTGRRARARDRLRAPLAGRQRRRAPRNEPRPAQPRLDHAGAVSGRPLAVGDPREADRDDCPLASKRRPRCGRSAPGRRSPSTRSRSRRWSIHRSSPAATTRPCRSIPRARRGRWCCSSSPTSRPTSKRSPS